MNEKGVLDAHLFEPALASWNPEHREGLFEDISDREDCGDRSGWVKVFESENGWGYIETWEHPISTESKELAPGWSCNEDFSRPDDCDELCLVYCPEDSQVGGAIFRMVSRRDDRDRFVQIGEYFDEAVELIMDYASEV